jgi:transposase-like protein
MKPALNLACPRCRDQHIARNGRSRHGHQRFVCRNCGATFGETDHRRVDEAKKQDALRHYAEGVGLRATERLVGVSHNSVMRWVRQAVAGKALATPGAEPLQTIEADELWSYVGKKKEQFGSGGLLMPSRASGFGRRTSQYLFSNPLFCL